MDGKKKQLRQTLRKDRQAQVVLEGVFRGPESAAIDPKLPDWMKEKLRGSKQRLVRPSAPFRSPVSVSLRVITNFLA